MRKTEIVDSIHRHIGLNKTDIMLVLETAFKVIKTELPKQKNIYVRGFGTFLIKKRAAKKGRIVKKNIMIDIPERFVPYFKPSKLFADQLHKKLNQINAIEKK